MCSNLKFNSNLPSALNLEFQIKHMINDKSTMANLWLNLRLLNCITKIPPPQRTVNLILKLCS